MYGAQRAQIFSEYELTIEASFLNPSQINSKNCGLSFSNLFFSNKASIACYSIGVVIGNSSDGVRENLYSGDGVNLNYIP